ncbi:MAG: TlpA family protein disulfide reductase [Bacteroidaceae bacterium]|nr:TlpA family protein disulfide reductase [Bacteroidaceae bacterium]
MATSIRHILLPALAPWRGRGWERVRLILAALLALCAVAGHAQVRTGLDLCLRDEVTGEWLIGLFDDYAVYGADYWQYEAADTVRHRYVLSRSSGERLSVELQQKKRRGAHIYKYSIQPAAGLPLKGTATALRDKYLPDYPQRDDAPFDATLLDAPQEATLRIAHASGKAGISVYNFIIHPLTTTGVNYEAETDARGRYEQRIGVAGEQVALLFTGTTRDVFRPMGMAHIPVALRPAGKLLIYVDDVRNRIYAMGDGARLVNELLVHPLTAVHIDYTEREQMTLPQFIATYDPWQAQCTARLDSTLAACPTLSARYEQFWRARLSSCYAYDLGQMLFNHPKPAREDLLQAARERGLTTSAAPILLQDRLPYALTNFASIAADLHFPLVSGTPYYEEMLREAEAGRLPLTEEECALVSNELPAVAALPTATYRDFDGNGYMLHGFTATDTLNLAPFNLRPEVADFDRSQHLRRYLAAIDSIGLSPELREFAAAQFIYKALEGEGTAFGPRTMQAVRENVHAPLLLHGIEAFNDSLIAYQQRSAQQAQAVSLAASSDALPASRLAVPADSLLGISYPQELLAAILAPFRGRAVYIDFWGTWCGPCRSEIADYLPGLRQEMSDLPVVYLFLCNRSSDEAWQTTRERLGMNFPEAVHYNLPADQQSALERHLSVGSFPTHRLADATGHIVPGFSDAPHHPDFVRQAVLKALGRE